MWNPMLEPGLSLYFLLRHCLLKKQKFLPWAVSCVACITMNSEKKCVNNTGMESMVWFPDNKFEASLQHCCKMNWTAKLHVLQPTFEPVLHQKKVARFFFLVGKMPAIAVQLILQQHCKTSRMSFVARVTVFYWYWNVTAKSIMACNEVPMTLRFIEVYWVGIVNQIYCW